MKNCKHSRGRANAIGNTQYLDKIPTLEKIPPIANHLVEGERERERERERSLYTFGAKEVSEPSELVVVVFASKTALCKTNEPIALVYAHN